MLGRRSREFPSHKTEAAGFAAKATDLDALRTAVVDAAGVGYGLWFSYLFALLYFAIVYWLFRGKVAQHAETYGH